MKIQRLELLGPTLFFRVFAFALLAFSPLVVRPNEWKTVRPVEYQLILKNGEVLTLRTLTARVQHHIDSVGLRMAFVAYKGKMVLQLEYTNDRVSQMSMRINGRKCSVPDSSFSALNGVDLPRTFLTWPGDAKRASDADHFCVELNYWLNESELPKFEPITICFSSDCSRVGSYEIVLDREQ